MQCFWNTDESQAEAHKAMSPFRPATTANPAQTGAIQTKGIHGCFASRISRGHFSKFGSTIESKKVDPNLFTSRLRVAGKTSIDTR